MISERAFAGNFDSVWHEILPMLTPSFVAMFNGTYVERLHDSNGTSVKPIPIDDTVTDHGLVAELAFHVALVGHRAGRPSSDVLTDLTMRQQAEEGALRALKSVLRSLPAQKLVSDADWSQVGRLVTVYDVFLESNTPTEIEFAPSLRGSGFLGQCYADLSVQDTLFEVKTVTRNFSAHDLRQLFIYLALDNATGKRRWQRGGFFNPRRGTAADFPIDNLLYKLSGGLAAAEVFNKIVNVLADRSLVVDTPF